MTQFDVVVIGAGPGGYSAAIRCAQSGLKTAIVERASWGGVTANSGAVPLKSLLRGAGLAHLLAHGSQAYGITGETTIDYGVAHARSRAASDHMVKGIHYLMRKHKITEYQGRAVFKDAETVAVSFDTGVVERLAFDHCVIATGAVPRFPPGVKPGPLVQAYDELMERKTWPESVVVAGGGAAGVEFAYLMSGYGAKVTVVEMADRLLPGADPEVSAQLARSFRELGIDLLVAHEVKGVIEGDDAVRVYVTPSRGGEHFMVEAGLLAVCTGVEPRTEGLDLAVTGVALTPEGAIGVDEAMRTNVPGLYAVGDVTGQVMLAGAAMAQGAAAAEAIAGRAGAGLDYAMMPRTVNCEPQVASFGHTEAAARALGLDVAVSKFPFAAGAGGAGEGGGFVKLVVDTRHREILGVHMIGQGVGELLGELSLAQLWDLTADELARNFHAHPSLSEAIREVSAAASGWLATY